MATVLHHHRGEVPLGHARGVHEALGPRPRSTPAWPRAPPPPATGRRTTSGSSPWASSRCRRRAPCRTAPPRMAPAPSMSGAPAGAARLHVDDGHAGHAQAGEHLVPRGHPAVGGAATRPGTRRAPRPPRPSAARTAATPMSVMERSSKRPKGWIPTPATATAVMCRPPTGRRRSRPRDGRRRRCARAPPPARLPARPGARRVCLGQAGHHPQPLGQLDHAEPVGHDAAVSGRRARDRCPRPQRARTRQLHRCGSLGRAVGTGVRGGEGVVPARTAPAPEEVGRIGVGEQAGAHGHGAAAAVVARRRHGAGSSGVNRAMPAASDTTSKVARTAMPMRTSSGAHPTMSVMRRGPSARSTRATT